MDALSHWLNQNRDRLEMRERIALEVIATRAPAAFLLPREADLLSSEDVAEWRAGYLDGVAALEAEAADRAEVQP